MAVAMALAEALHHSSGPKVMERAQHAALRGQKTGTRAGVAGPAPVAEYVAPAPAVAPFSTPAASYEAPAPVVGYVAPAPSVAYAESAPVFEYVAPAPVLEYIAPAPAVSVVAPSQQLRPAYTADAVTTGVNLDAEFVGSASQVVGSLPLGEVFAAPVFPHVHLEQIAGGDIPETLPPSEEFLSPVHHEQFSAGDMTENFAFFPFVPEQVIPLRVVDSLPHAEEFTAYVARRPPPLVDVRPSSRAQRHIMEGLGGLAPLVQILDLPVPQTVDSVMEVLRFLDLPLAEQAISVPKISCSSCPSRACVPEPQLADQLVEVPTVLTPSRIALLNAEQIVDNPVDDDYGLLLVFCENCEFLVKRRNEWQSQGHGVAKLLWHSEDLVFFQFWQEEQLIIADVVRRVGAPPLVLRPARGQGQRTWVWSVPDLADGLSHAVRFASHELGRRFHDEWEPTL